MVPFQDVSNPGTPEVFAFDWFSPTPFAPETNLPPVVETTEATANSLRDRPVVLALDAPEPRLEIVIPRLTAYLLQPSSEAPFKAAEPEEKK